jgi:hypothetical protein
MAMHESDIERVVRQGSQAWQRLKKDKNWGDWIKVGEAHIVGREWAMHQATTNQPKGKAYNMAFGEWLAKYKFDDMDKGNRARLFEVMDNLGQIEEWRRTLTLGERLRLNHPNAVLRKWKAHLAPERRTESGEPKPTLRDSVVNLSEEVEAKNREIAQLKDHIAELEAARDTVDASMKDEAMPALPRWIKHLAKLTKGMTHGQRIDIGVDVCKALRVAASQVLDRDYDRAKARGEVEFIPLPSTGRKTGKLNTEHDGDSE